VCRFQPSAFPTRLPRPLRCREKRGLRLYIDAVSARIPVQGQVETLTNRPQCRRWYLEHDASGTFIDKLIVKLVLVIDPQVGAQLGGGRDGRRRMRGIHGSFCRARSGANRGRGSRSGRLRGCRARSAGNLQRQLGWGDAHGRSLNKRVRRGPGWSPPSGIPQFRLPEQFQNGLLLGVGLRQGGDAGLFQNLELGHVRHYLSNIRVLDAAQRGSEVL